VSVTVPAERAEEARAAMLELFPAGFEEADRPGVLELAAYTDAAGATRLWRAFGEYSWSEVPEDWQHRWREFHRAVQVGQLWVGPPWLKAPDDAVAVVIDPGRAFGTGAHPTTQLCLQVLIDLPSEGRSLLDIGCGSGVLAIAGGKLGFEPVIALDHDPVTLESAATNARKNGVRAELRLAEALEDPLPPADVAVANISATAIESVAERVDAVRLVTSGYLAREHPRLERYCHLERRELDGWAADVWSRPE
jgi:ribosomal protein L11 methyltransferase